MSSNVDLNSRPDYDDVIKDIAEYVTSYNVESKEAIDTARNCLIDSIGCGLLALQFKECTKHLGPIVENTKVPFGSRVPGTNFILDPVKAAWDIGCIIRWLDYNDTWLAAEWGHPSDNLGSILGLSDHTSGHATVLGAVTLGAKVIEKHFTLNKSDTTIRDHAVSATPEEFKNLVELGRDINKRILNGI